MKTTLLFLFALSSFLFGQVTMTPINPALTPAQNRAPIDGNFSLLNGKHIIAAGVPSLTCSATVNLGFLYIRTDAAAGSASLYVCAKTASNTYAWEGPFGAASAFDVAGAATTAQAAAVTAANTAIAAAQGQLGTGPLIQTETGDTTTVAGLLVDKTTSGGVTLGAAALAGHFGICVSGCGTAGPQQIARAGKATAMAGGAITAGDILQPCTTGTQGSLCDSGQASRQGVLSTTDTFGKAAASVSSGASLTLDFIAGERGLLVPTSQVSGLSPGAYSIASPMLYQIALSNILANKTTFSDGSAYYKAAPGYTYSYISDTALAIDGLPDAFPVNDLRTLIGHYISQAGTNGTVPAGSIPIVYSTSGGTINYCAGFDAWCHWPTAEGIFSLVHLEKKYYDRSGDLSRFATDATVLDTAMGTIRLDATTKIPVSPAGAEYVCFGFQETIRFTGLLGTCAMQMWRVSTELATLYSLVGNGTLQAKYAGYATTIAANLGTSSALWNAGAGMFNGATIQDAQIDTTASALFCSLKIPSPNAVAQCAAISAYFVANASTLTYKGYVRQSNVDFAAVGALTSGSTPYDTSNVQMLPATYQRGGFWSHFNKEVIETMALTSIAAAQKMVNDFVANADPTMEYYAPFASGSAPANGFTNNLESPVGTLAAIREFPGLVTFPSLTSGSGAPSGSCVSSSYYVQSAQYFYGCLASAWVGPLGGTIAPTAPTGVLAYWALQEGSSPFADSSHTNAMTGSNLAFASQSGITGGNIPVFNGTSSIAAAANNTNTNVNGSSPFCVAIRATFTNIGASNDTLVGNVDGANNAIGWQLTYNANSLIFFLISNFGAGNAVQVAYPFTPTSGQLYGIIACTDGSKAAAGVTMYLDNSALNSPTVPNNGLTGTIANSKPITLGAGTAGSYWHTGRLADVGLYDHVLSSSERAYIQAHP